MKTIEVCLSPDLVHLHADLEEKVVVVADIMRATSCIVTGLGSGVKAIRPVETLEEAEQWKAKGYFTAGERNGIKIPHFDMGNSPFSFMEDRYTGQAIVMTTTNGTRAIHKTKSAFRVIIGAFLNFSAVASYLERQNKNVLVICAGWKGRLSLEDTLFAGALVSHLTPKGYTLLDDEALAAKTIYEANKENLLAYYLMSGHAKRLRGLGIKDDLIYCMKMDAFQVLPYLAEDELVIEDLD